MGNTRVSSFLFNLLNLLGLIGGCATAFAIFGHLPESELDLLRSSSDYTAMPVTDRQALQEAFEAFKGFSADRRQRVETTFNAVKQDGVLAAKLTMLNEWYLSLPPVEQTEWRTKIVAADVAAVAEKIQADLASRDLIVVDFSFGARFSRTQRRTQKRPASDSNAQVSPLTLSISDYSNIIDTAFPDSELPHDERLLLAQFESPSERLLCKTLLVIDRLRKQHFAQGSLASFYEVFEAHIDSIDSSWRHEWESLVRKSERNPMASGFVRVMIPMSILDQAVIALSQPIRGSISPDSENLVDAFAEIQDEKVRRDLMNTDPESARFEIEQILLLSQYDQNSARHQLAQRLVNYERSLDAMGFLREIGGRGRFPVREDDPGR
ncbi:MAG: hypothetical protein KDA91_10395 [Planctomycetaceae bacterium]|nr:hypothetical protein [Planctomycetaceae bacterium]